MVFFSCSVETVAVTACATVCHITVALISPSSPQAPTGCWRASPALPSPAAEASELLQAWGSLDALERELEDLNSWLQSPLDSDCVEPGAAAADDDDDDEDLLALEESASASLGRLRVLVASRASREEEMEFAEYEARVAASHAIAEAAQLRALTARQQAQQEAAAEEVSHLRRALAALERELRRRDLETAAAPRLLALVAQRDADVAVLTERLSRAHPWPAAAPSSPGDFAEGEFAMRAQQLQQQLSELRDASLAAAKSDALAQAQAEGDAGGGHSAPRGPPESAAAGAARRADMLERALAAATAAAAAASGKEAGLRAREGEASRRVGILEHELAAAREEAEAANLREARLRARDLEHSLRAAQLAAELEAACDAAKDAAAREEELVARAALAAQRIRQLEGELGLVMGGGGAAADEDELRSLRERLAETSSAHEEGGVSHAKEDALDVSSNEVRAHRMVWPFSSFTPAMQNMQGAALRDRKKHRRVSHAFSSLLVPRREVRGETAGRRTGSGASRRRRRWLAPQWQHCTLQSSRERGGGTRKARRGRTGAVWAGAAGCSSRGQSGELPRLLPLLQPCPPEAAAD